MKWCALIILAIAGCGPKTTSISQTTVDNAFCVQDCIDENWFNDTTNQEILQPMCEKKFQDKFCCKYDVDKEVVFDFCQ